MTKIGDMIRKMREERGMSLQAFGELVGATKRMVHLWEHGKNEPNVSHLKAIAEATSFPIEKLLEGCSD